MTNEKSPGRPRKHPERHAHDLEKAKRLDAYQGQKGLEEAGKICAVLATELADWYNKAVEYPSSPRIWMLFRSHVEAFAHNSGAAVLQRGVTQAVPRAHTAASQRRTLTYAREFAALDQGRLALEDASPDVRRRWRQLKKWRAGKLHPLEIPEEVWIALPMARGDGDTFMSGVLAMADESLHQLRGSEVHPARLILGTKSGHKQEVRYSTKSEAGEVVASLVHEWMNRGLALKSIISLFKTFMRRALSYTDARALYENILLQRRVEAAREIGKVVPARVATRLRDDVNLAQFNELQATPAARKEFAPLTALLCLCGYLLARARCVGAKKVAHVRLCGAPACSAPAFTEVAAGEAKFWPPTPEKRTARPVYYCLMHRTATSSARMDRLRRRRKSAKL